MAKQSPLQVRARRGFSVLYATVTLVIIIGFVAFAVDLGRVQLSKTQLQSATDAAARYGATALPSGVAAVKQRIVQSAAESRVDGTPLVIDQNNDIEFGTWDPVTRKFTVLTGPAQSSATAIRLTGRRIASRGTGVPLTFASLLGPRTFDLSASSVISFQAKANDIFLIQDITTSFKEELPDAKSGLQKLLTNLYSGGASGRIAVAVHTGWGKTLAPFTAIASNYSYLSSTINSIQPAGSSGMPKASGTDIASGFDEAIAAFTASGYVAPTGAKAVVLVSDGQPSKDSGGKHPTLSDSQLLTLAQTRANTLWANNVHVYVVFMDSDNDPNAANKVKTLIRGNGDFVRVTDPNLLPAALADITTKIGTASLVR